MRLLGQEYPPEQYYPNGQLMYRYSVVDGKYEGGAKCGDKMENYTLNLITTTGN